jgi:hypothetical protein
MQKKFRMYTTTTTQNKNWIDHLSSAYRRKIDRKKYLKKWINMKIVTEINKTRSSGSRYYLFRKVLSTIQVKNAISKLPRYGLFALEEGRSWAQNGNQALQTFLRNQYIHFRKSEEEEDVEESRQKMLLQDFYLAIAQKLGLEHANLSPNDKCIQHDKDLSVTS